MQMLKMLYDEIQDAVDRKVPFVIPIGTLEYHARHASCVSRQFYSPTASYIATQ